MTTWTSLGTENNDCCIEAAGQAIRLWRGQAPSDAEIDRAHRRFCSKSGMCNPGRLLWQWWLFGIGGYGVGGFARISPSQIEAATRRFGCAYVLMHKFDSVEAHCVLVEANGIVSWGQEYPLPLVLGDVNKAFAIARSWHPILIWWALINTWQWHLIWLPLFPIIWAAIMGPPR